jgi:hypothetical protein
MATYEKVKLSGAGTKNAPVDFSYSTVTAHTTGTSSTILDEVWLYVNNNGVMDVDSSIDIVIDGKYIRWVLPPESTTLIFSGVPVAGSGSAGTTIQVEDASGNGNTLLVYGYVNRITP